MDETSREHKVIIDNRNVIKIGAVDDIESFDEEKVVVLCSMGTMTITGKDFKMNKLNVDDGQLIVEGEIDEIAYSNTVSDEKGGGFFGRLFR